LAAVAILVPAVKAPEEHGKLSDDLAVLARPQVLLALLTTILGWIGIFALFTYIAPILTRVSGFSDAAVSPILLVFGAGAIVGNLLGGRFADRWPAASVFGSLLALAVVLALMSFAAHSQLAVVISIALLGAAAFATASPLQMAVLHAAEGAGQSLASSFNIAAFNLGNAIGAWLGGMVIVHGSLDALPWVAALAPLAGVAVTLYAVRLGRARRPVPAAAA
jgi:DHA1 family inner membrane transport protein